MNKLTGKTALITGGNSGIGYETARLFLQEGATVIITGRRADAVKDAGSMSDLDALPSKVAKISSAVDILFTNAGVGLFAPFEQTTEALFDANMDINFKGAYFTIQKLLKMIPDGSSIILNSTILVHSGMETTTAYTASKGAVLSLGKTLATELAGRNIRVNTISPGPINTPIYSKMGMPADVLQAFAAGVQAKIPLKRFGQPNDIANAVLFLASEESSFLTGTELTVDGGKAIAF
jgi:NAD(P)-dependent dehydrogenase (short-subunit alcohol dehydrogenase family)